jgi:hypothetical protein
MKMRTRAIERITAQQLAWAKQNKIALERSYTSRVEDNIFGGQLYPATRLEYEKGKGHELEGHMKALHSSSALVVNVFDYWRRVGRIQDIGDCCGADGPVESMEFEKTHPIKGVTRTPPHLDVEFGGTLPLAIEAKFTETYRRKTRRPLANTHLDKYIEKDDIWVGLPRLRAVAECIVRQSADRTQFEYLDVPQLVKHALGLNGAYKGRFSLLYLWYRIDSPEVAQHENELGEFSAAMGNEIKFRTMTYQEVFNRIRRLPNVDPAYVGYLEARYFPVGERLSP